MKWEANKLVIPTEWLQKTTSSLLLQVLHLTSLQNKDQNQENNFGTVLLTNIQVVFKYPFAGPASNSGSHIAFNCISLAHSVWNSFSVFNFCDLTLESYTERSMICSHWCFFMIQYRLCILAKVPQNWCALLWAFFQETFAFGNIHIDHLVKAVSPLWNYYFHY